MIRMSIETKGRMQGKINGRDEIVGEVNEHTHPPSQTTCEIARLKGHIKDREETTQDAPPQILADALGAASESASINLLRIESLRRTIRSHRRDDDRSENPINRAAIPVLAAQYPNPNPINRAAIPVLPAQYPNPNPNPINRAAIPVLPAQYPNPNPNPINRVSIPVLPAQYQRIKNGEQFLLYDSGVGDINRILIFASNQAIQLQATLVC